jgi:hypothetical protein
MLFGRFDAAEAAGVALNATIIKPNRKNFRVPITAPSLAAYLAKPSSRLATG